MPSATETNAAVNKFFRQLHDSFPFFLKQVWRQVGLPEPHRVQYDVADYLQSGPKKKIVRGYRGLSKTWITAAYVLWRLPRNPNERVLFVSASKGHCRQTMHMIRQWMNTVPFLRVLAPKQELRAGDIHRKWRDSTDEIDVGPSEADRVPSITAMGIESHIPGIRPTIIISDDIETPENVITIENRSNLKNRAEQLEFTLSPGGDVIYLGTPYCEDTVYDHLSSRRAGESHDIYDMRTWPVKYPTKDELVPRMSPMLQKDLDSGRAKPGDFVWPERHGEEYCRSLVTTRRGFKMQMMLISDLGEAYKYPLKVADLIIFPVHRDKAPVSIAWGQKTNSGSTACQDIPSPGFGEDRFYGPIMVDERWKEYSVTKGYIDPAGAGLRNPDEMALAIIGELHGTLFLKHVDGVRGGPTHENLTKFVLALRDHGATEVAIEENFGGAMLIRLIEPIIRRYAVNLRKDGTSEDSRFPRGWNCLLTGIHSSAQKEIRIIDSLEPVMVQHRLVVDRKVAFDTTLMSQLVRITRERKSLEHDDRIEAVATCAGQFLDFLHQDANVIVQKTEDQEREETVRAHWAELSGQQVGNRNWLDL